MKKRSLTLVCKDENGNTQMVLVGAFSITDIKGWAEQYGSVEVRCSSRGRQYVRVVKCDRESRLPPPPEAVASAPLSSYPIHHHQFLFEN